MADQVVGLTIKAVGDFSDVVSNVNGVQKALTKLKLPDKLGDSLNKNISNFVREYDKYQKKLAEGIHTQGDQNAVNKSLNSMLNSYEKIIRDFSKLSSKDFKDIFNLDDSAFASIQKRIRDIQAEIKKIKIDPKQLSGPMAEIAKMTNAKALFGEGKGLNKLQTAIDTHDFTAMKEAIAEVETYYNRFSSKMSEQKRIGMGEEIKKLKAPILEASSAADKLEKEFEEANQDLLSLGSKASSEMRGASDALDKTRTSAERVTDELKRIHNEEFSFNREAQNIDRQIQSYFGLSQMIRKVGDIAKDAFTTVKELDAAMTETAVVTNFSVGDMWEMLPTYTAQANQLGSTIKDVYEAATLYYQQGLNTNQSMGLANETLKMARIAGLDAAEATNMMTAALRGFNMEINQVSAQKINDVYSELAAITASDTQEIGSAMERTASIANSANMEFDTTSAFLAQMIETTREAPENLGTAMKTIVARFQEMKQDPTKLIDSEGVAMDANKVDTALKTIGVDLMNQKGEFRDLDDVFLDIAARWDSLTQGQQRYIATIAAGSRQQSRFIAMMSNYERTMELVDAANNSAGASQRQFEKTLDSMSSKLNMLKNAWDQFTMGLMNNQILKFGVDRLTDAFTIVNKFIDILGSIPPKPFEGITKSVLTLVTTLSMLNLGKKGARGLVMGGAAWWKGEEGGFTKNFMAGFSGNAAKAGTADGQIYAQNFNNAIKKLNFKKAFDYTKQRASTLDTVEYENTFQGAFGQFSAKELSAGWSSEIETEIRNAFLRASTSVNASVWGEEDGNEYIEGLITQMRSGQLSASEAANALRIRTGGKVDISNLGVNAMPTKEVEQLSNSFTKAGVSLQTFGMALQDTPLAPFGAMISKIGMLVSGFGEMAAKAFAIFQAGATGTAVAEAEVGAGAATMAAGEAVATATTYSLVGGIKALWGALLASPLFPIIAALAGLVAAYKLLDFAIETDAERMEAATDAAAAASEAYDSAKQETSELADSIAKIRETDSAFDNLVAGTAQFNEQLVTANEQITALINKYPMLLEADKNYVTTDANGLMHISEAGLQAVQDYQKQIQARASAVNLIQTADLNRLEQLEDATKLTQSDSNDKKKHEQNIEEARLLRERANAERELARNNAIRITLQDKELRSAEALTSIYSSQYEMRRKQAEKEVADLSKHEIREQYADFHGYTYNKANKKITDVEGNEIDYNDAAIKDEVTEQKVLLNFEANAESLDNTLKAVDSRFAQSLDERSEFSSHFISDVLSSNIDTDEDLLKQVLTKGNTQLQDTVNSMSETEMAAILGISADQINQNNINKKRDEIVDLLKTDAINIVSAQAKSYEDLAVMMAQSKGWDIVQAGQQENQKTIENELKQLKAEQIHSMSNIGNQLKENAGLDTMEAYISHMSELYKKIDSSGLQADKDAAKEIENIFNESNLSSAEGRLEAYDKLMQSSAKDAQNLGKAMRTSASEANLLGDVFDEFLGGDWTELSENADQFKNSLGEIDGAGILKASEESHTLKTLLDSGEVSASGLAMALQGIEDGKYSVGAVNESVLLLLSSLNKLEDEALKAHNLIENFDAGIDYGEGEDFVKDNAEKAQEYYDNGEWGNQQLQNYIKLAAGEERWNEALKKHHGDLQLAEQDLMKYVNTFKDGFQPAWDQMIAGKGINGKSLVSNIKSSDISDELKEKFKQVETYWDDDGYMHMNFGELTTEELELYFQEAYGVSKEYAQLLLQDLANYDGTVSAMLAKNDLMTLTDPNSTSVNAKNFRASHTDANGNIVLSDQEIKIIEEAGGNLDKVAENLGTTTEELKNSAFKVLDEEGNRIDNTDNTDLLNNYIKTFGKAQEGNVESLIKTGNKDEEGKDLFTNNRLDISKLITDLQSHNLDQNQSIQAAWQAYQEAQRQGQTTNYDGVTLDNNYKTIEEFQTGIQNAIESQKWQAIGEAIAQGMINSLQQLLPDWMTPGDTITPQSSEDDSPGSKHQRGGRAAERDEFEGQNGGARYVAQYEAQQSAQALANANATNEQIKSSMTEAANKMAEAGMKNNEIANALNKSYGTNLQTGDVKIGEDGKVQLNVDTENLQEQLSNVTADVTANVTSITMGGTGGGRASGGSSHHSRASGQNNPNSIFRYHGTMARGSRGGYTIAGRPTLTGEEGEELVWEPRRNEAYMVGSNGPQFANISKDAVVWNAEQTKRIKKNSKVGNFGTGARGISHFGTMNEGNAGGLKIPGLLSVDATAAIQDVTPPAKEPTIPVKGKLEIEGNSGGILGKVKSAFGGGKEKGSITENVSISLNSSIANPEEPKEKIKKTIPEKYDASVSTSITLKSSVNTGNTKQQIQKAAENSGKGVNANAKIPKVSASTQTINVTANTSAAQAKINQLINLFHKTYTLKYKASGPSSIKVPISANFTGSWTKKVEITKSGAKGINNHISYHSKPIFGSAAKGPYGTIGPKNRGGLTLTGEEGYEVAWLPSENRSMILGMGGPQMLALPSDAVVYTHKQSEEILKRQSIDAGSHAKTGRRRSGSNAATSNSGNSNNKKGTKKKHKGTGSSQDESNVAAISNIIVWWDNITRRADETQRRADKNQKTYEKYLKEIRATLKKTGIEGGGNAFIKNTNKAISLYTQQLNRANAELKNLNVGTAAQRKAAKTKGTSDDKKANNAAFNAEQGGAVRISYEAGKGKKKKTKNEVVATAGFIKEQDGTYVIDQQKLNKISNKNRRKALADALNKEINDRISKRNKAEDDIQKARDALEAFAKQLYETFFAWENELTRIWNITQKIEQIQSRLNRGESFESLLEAQLSTGKAQAGKDSTALDLKNFRNRLQSQNELLQQRQKVVTESQQVVQKLLNSEEEKTTLSNIESRLKANQQAADKANKKAKLDAAKQAKKNYDSAIANRKTVQTKLNSVQAKINKLNNKKKLTKAQKKELKNLKAQRDSLIKQRNNYNKIINNNRALAGKVSELQKAYNDAAAGVALSATEKAGYEQYRKELQNRIAAQDMARKYTKITRRADGTIDIHFDTDSFEQARLDGNISAEMAKSVQEWVKNLQEATGKLQESYEEYTKTLTEFYTQLDTLQDEWGDYGKQLTEITENYEKAQLNRLKKLSDSIKKALDELLAEVKRKLEERRRLEDNAKTERDISQKQQRLAMLRADTAGGNQVEIAQLEKEIAEAQQSYQRTLEDQLINKLEEQNDLAAKQRERQIELQEEISEATNNIEKVNRWMANPELYEDEIRKQYYANAKYDEVTAAEQKNIANDFEKFYNGLLTNQTKQEELSKSIDELTSELEEIERYLILQNQTLATAKDDGYTAKQAQELFNASLQELRTEGNYDFDDFKASEYSNDEIRQAGFSASEFKTRDIPYLEAKSANYTLDELEKAGYTEATAEKAAAAAAAATVKTTTTATKTTTPKTTSNKQTKYNDYINYLKSVKKIKPANVKSSHINSLFTKGAAAGYGKASVLLHLVSGTGGSDPFTWKNIFRAIIDASGINRYNLVKTFGSNGTLPDAVKTLKSNPNTISEIKKHKSYKSASVLKYKTGGIADFTGPAWLDGTPSKPELVLNAQDTKNFIALKDVLSRAIGATSDLGGNYGDMTYEININVEKLTSDYDVDKVADRVKKIIVKDASYRNVTQVRKFR